jgi:hypothetical protein
VISTEFEERLRAEMRHATTGVSAPSGLDAEGPDLHLLHSTASSKVSYTTTSPSALVAHLNNKLRLAASRSAALALLDLPLPSAAA